MTTRSSLTLQALDFGANARAGCRLALLRPNVMEYLRPSVDQLALLIGFNLILACALDFVESWPQPEFNGYALPDQALGLAGILLASYLTARLAHNLGAAIDLAVATYSLLPWFYLLSSGLRLVEDHLWAPGSYEAWTAYGVLLVWLAAAIGRAIHAVLGRGVLVGVCLFAAAWGAPGVLYTWQSSFWYEQRGGGDAALLDTEDKIDAERLLYAQPELMSDAVDKLKHQRPGVPDLYFVGFGGDASEDVFLKEVRYVQELFGRRFDTAGRALSLVNNAATVEELPLATATNLDIALDGIGGIINPKEDVVAVFLTSHGAPNHDLAVSFWPLPLNPVTPQSLKQALDDAGIKWRIIIVSACYSGGFLTPLRDPNTLVMTASAADKTSFGCGVDRDFTYFGEALFRDQLTQGGSLPEAFRLAAAAIQQREHAEGLSPSQPQMYIGPNIAARLPQWEKQWGRRYCAQNPKALCGEAAVGAKLPAYSSSPSAGSQPSTRARATASP